MSRIAALAFMLGVVVLAAQAPDTSITTDIPRTTEPAPDSLRLRALPAQLSSPKGVTSPFYYPPSLRELWQHYITLVDTIDNRAFNRRFVQNLLDSLIQTVQSDFDSLVQRARAFELGERGYTHQYFRSPVTREQILGESISEEEAREEPHFHAVYDPQGYLLRVRYIEPRAWRAKQELAARGVYRTDPATIPQVRYFQAWDMRKLRPVDYTRKKKIPERQPYFRVVYNSENDLRLVQGYHETGALKFGLDFERLSADKATYIRLEFAGDSTGSLLDLHPYMYLGEWSLIKPGWKAALTRDEQGYQASTQVFNHLNQISYYYTFRLEADSTSKNTLLQCTVLSGSDRILKVYALKYDLKDRLIERLFYSPTGELQTRTTYDYNRRSSELMVITRTADGVIISRQKYIDPDFWN
jgi:hypothetical protein